MNEIKNVFLLAGDTFMSGIHLRQLAALEKSGFTKNTCGPFTNNKKEYKTLKNQEIYDILVKQIYRYLIKIY